MAIAVVNEDRNRIGDARETFTGKRLTTSQFEESWALAGVVEREIRKSGSFKEKLGDYAHAFSRTEKFDPMKAETIIRDQFRARYGETMNQMREGLMGREQKLDKSAVEAAIAHARDVGRLIKEGETMPFYRAYDDRAVQLARELKITESGAKTLMKDSFREQEGKELYDWGKAIEKEFHTSKMEAEKAEREATRSQKRPHPRPR